MRNLFLAVFALFLNFRAQNADSLTFSEIMFYQPQNNCEFIEIYNFSSTASFDISGLKIKYENAQTDSTRIVSGDSLLRPGEFAVIFEGDYNFDNPFYSLPDSAIVLKILDNNFGASGMSNSSDKTLRLISAEGDTLSVYRYSADNGKGISDEKILLYADNSQNNWANSFSENGTPGAKNSVTPFNFDLEVASVACLNDFIEADDTFSVNVTVKNVGLIYAENSQLKVFADTNGDSLFGENEIIFNTNLPGISYGDSLVISTVAVIADTGYILLKAEVVWAADENLSNNFKLTLVHINPPLAAYSEICINEIKYLPQPGEPEWVEIKNNSDSLSFNLKDWKISDAVSSKKIIARNFFIEPKEFVVLASDDAINDFYEISSRIIYLNLPSLNNSGDKLKLTDSFGNIVDSVNYRSSWNNGAQYSSLEKIISANFGNDSTQWRACINPYRGTPGAINSVSPKDFDFAAESLICTPEFPLINEEVSISAKIINLGRQDAQCFVTLFYDADRDSIAEEPVATEELSLSAGNYQTITFAENILIDKEKFFSVKIENSDDQDTTNNSANLIIKPSYLRNSVQINEVLFEPQQGECEWIELVNNTSLSVNLKDWTISDVLRSPHRVQISSAPLYLDKNEKIVIAKDSSFLDFHNEIPDKFVIIELPNLNNSKDGIVIKDANGKTIDSLFYRNSWLEMNNRSLERIFLDAPTNDSLNWGASLDEEFSTPGRKNSISPFDYDLAITKILIDTSNLTYEILPLEVTVTNAGLNVTDYSTLTFFNDANCDTTGSFSELIREFEIASIEPFDSLTLHLEIPNSTTGMNLLVSINSDADQNTQNNYGYLRVPAFYERGAIKINEIHYAPINGEPEWIEFQNAFNDTVNLEKMTVSDLFREPNETEICNEQLFIAPGEKFITTKDSSILSYHAEIPSKLIVVKFANLNNDVEGIIIKNAFGVTLDSVYFNAEWGGNNGRSLERISLNSPSGDSLNWASSLDEELSTPGRKNSVSPKIFDITVDSVYFFPLYPAYDERITATVNILNAGNETIERANVTMFENGAASDSAIIRDLPAGNHKTLSFRTKNFVGDSLEITIKAKLSGDENNSNNIGKITVYSGVNAKEILVSEFMATPASSGEWIEVYNNSQRQIKISMFSVFDSASYAGFLRFPEDEQLLIEPEAYFVFCADSVAFDSTYGKMPNRLQVNFGSLNNAREIIYVTDFRGNLIDSLRYNNWQFKRGFSFEKIDLSEANFLENWAASIDSQKATPGKQNSVNNLHASEFNDIIINEIMFEPAAGNCEFFELYNRSDFPVQIGGWQFYENSGKRKTVSATEFILQPGKYFIVASDSSILNNYDLENAPLAIINSDLSLGNDEDIIVLLDFTGNVIDSVRYSKTWHNPSFNYTNNRSLERISPDFNSNSPANWSSSLATLKATPGKRNSVYQKSAQKTVTLSIEPNPFSPDNDGFEDVTFIKYSLDANIDLVRIRIYDSKGRLVRTLTDNLPTGADGEIIFDGRDEFGEALPLGIYILLFEQRKSGKTVRKIVKPLVIARKL